MNESITSAARKQSMIQAVLREYHERIDRGEHVDCEMVFSRHPEIASELRLMLKGESRSHAGENENSSEAGSLSTKSIAHRTQDTVPPRAAVSVGEGLSGQFGRYKILRALGRGAMGAVYLAEDTQLRRQVAIKTPHFDGSPTGEVPERFYREARAAATLRHPSICPVYDVGEIDGRHFISMAYIEGRPLSDLVRQGKVLSERQILIAVRKLAHALREAHELGIVHRDLKPANVMVDKHGSPIIMDFGLARRTQHDDIRLTQSGAIIGTPAYMSPEQVEGLHERIGAVGSPGTELEFAL